MPNDWRVKIIVREIIPEAIRKSTTATFGTEKVLDYKSTSSFTISRAQ